MWLVFQCSVDLSADFGDVDEPKLKTSKGSNYDRVISPVSLYVMSLNDGLKLFDHLGDYPWISQNIKNITMIPRDFIYKYMFIYLYDFANGKILLYILGIYIVIPIYFQMQKSV